MPVVDGDRAFIALSSAHVVALALADGEEAWRVARNVTAPMAAASGHLFLAAGDAIEALRGSDGATAWVAPRLTPTAPLVVAGATLVVATETEVVALRTDTGAIAWRAAAGGVRLAPEIDADRVFVGANDGHILGLDLATGAVVWEQDVPLGVTALAASGGRVYVGAGDKKFYCFDARGKGKSEWDTRIGAIPAGHIAVDEDRVYFTALDNVVRGLDRKKGNQRWLRTLPRRPVAGVHLAGGVLFVEVSGTELVMLLARSGDPSGVVTLPGEATSYIPIATRETDVGVEVFVVTGGLGITWQLTRIGPAGEAALEPFDRFVLPGLPFLSDPHLVPLARVVPWLVMTDPPLQPFSSMLWPIVMTDPPLEPLTMLPGIQLRPLSPVLPVRRGG